MIEAKNREARLKMKTPTAAVAQRQDSGDGLPAAPGSQDAKSAIDLKDPVLVQSEQDYMAVIEAVNRRCYTLQ